MKPRHAHRLCALFAIVSLFFAASCSSSSSADKDEETTQAAVEQTDRDTAQQVPDSDVVPIGDSPMKGPADAPVTIVEFADYQCPFCAKSHKTMTDLEEKYGDKIRVVFKHYPLPFHKQAEAASRAAIAAGEQGQFWKMHDLLFRYQNVMKGKSDAQMKEWTAGFAAEMGLDVEQFKKDFDADSTLAQIEADMELVDELGIKGTPQFLINGHRIKGAQPAVRFEEVIDKELAVADELRDEADNFYAQRVEENFDKPEPPSRDARRPNKTKVAFVPVDDEDPVRGETDDPLVTVVAFSDFQCPFCNKVVPTLERIEREYDGEVRIVFKQLPLSMHAQAEMAAEIALAAQEQGKFWEMHDLLFERQREMRGKSDDQMVEWAAKLAGELGLDADKLASKVRQGAHEQEIEKEKKLASRIGARGTPNFWINGLNVVGAQPYSRFEEVIDEQLTIARRLQKEDGLSGEALYKAAVEYNEDNTPQAKEPTRPDAPDKKVDVSDLTIDGDQVKNADNYDVTVFAFADYECPYCSRGHDNLHAAIGQVDADVRLVFKHYPLPFHKNARPAARAAMAAGEQGKFWEMSDALFEEQKRLNEDGFYVEKARELGLDVGQFEKDMKTNAKAYDKQIEADMKQGQAIGVRGTPAYYIGDQRVVGAQPTQKLVDTIEAEAQDDK